MLDQDALASINAYSPGLSSAWMLQRAMSVRPGQAPRADFINRLLGQNFEAMRQDGQATLKTFLQARPGACQGLGPGGPALAPDTLPSRASLACWAKISRPCGRTARPPSTPSCTRALGPQTGWGCLRSVRSWPAIEAGPRWWPQCICGCALQALVRGAGSSRPRHITCARPHASVASCRCCAGARPAAPPPESSN